MEKSQRTFTEFYESEGKNLKERLEKGEITQQEYDAAAFWLQEEVLAKKST